MFNEVSPPVNERTTKELLSMIGSSQEWRQDVIDLTRAELAKRKVTQNEIDHAKYLFERKGSFEALKKAKQSFSIESFISRPFATLFVVLFYWEYEKDGYLRKARQQKIIRKILLIIISITIIVFFVINSFNADY